jgi:hypothetical protein
MQKQMTEIHSFFQKVCSIGINFLGIESKEIQKSKTTEHGQIH